MTQVVFRPEALADLAAIALYVAEHSVARANDLIDRLRERCNILEKHPEAGRRRDELAPGIRSLFERPYLILYRLKDGDAEIVAVIHAMRDLPASFASRVASEEG